MNRQRHPHNRNLILLLNQTEWNGFRIQQSREGIIENYLCGIYSTLNRTVTEYPRSYVLRFDLHVPKSGQARTDQKAISRFMDSLRDRLKADLARKARGGKRVYPCRLRYVWAREQKDSPFCHYHVAIMLNRGAYFTLGKITKAPDQTNACIDHEDSIDFIENTQARENMFTRISAAWASALKIELTEVKGLVHIPTNPGYSINRNAAEFDQQFKAVFYRLSYLAKAITKSYGNHVMHFGSSRD